MDYERINKVQTGVISPRLSPRKLRLKLVGVQRGWKASEHISAVSSSTEGPDNVALAECAKYSLLSSESGNVNDEGVSGVEGFQNSKEDVSAHDFGYALQTTKLSTTPSVSEEIPNSGTAAQYSEALKDFHFKENQQVQLKVQNFTKPTSTQMEYANSLNFVHAMRSFEDDNFEYDSGHENTSVSSFEFHKADRAPPRRVLGPHSKPAPSKWDDAEKWLVNLSSGDSHARNKLKSGLGYPQGVAANHAKKSGFPGQGGRQMGNANVLMTKTTSNASGVTEMASAGQSLNQEEVETKKIYPDKYVSSLDDGGPSKFAFMPSVAHSTARADCSLDCYSLENISGCDPSGQREVNDGEALLRPSPRIEKPIADPTINISKHDPSSTQRTTPLCVPPSSTVKSVSMRDMGTEMTPIASQEPSRTGTPVRATTPTMRSPVSSRPSTPGRVAPSSSPMDINDNELGSQAGMNASELSERELHAKTRREIIALGTKLGKDNIAAWASKQQEEENASKSLEAKAPEPTMMMILEARATAWEEAEKAKYMARYKSEEVKIQAWENHQKAKAEAEMKRIEVKVERIRGHAHEKLMNKLAASRHRAEEKLAAAEAKRNRQAAKTAQRAEYIRQTGHMPSPFSHWCCL